MTVCPWWMSLRVCDRGLVSSAGFNRVGWFRQPRCCLRFLAPRAKAGIGTALNVVVLVSFFPELGDLKLSFLRFFSYFQ